ncbi:MAG: restriction endonuclease, partial [Fibrobacter sp.]|nr:restriction endonuclease [Fibrobacter sp.]
NEVERFKNIQAGDYIIVPFYSGIALAVAESEELYNSEAYELDLSNQRRAAFRYADKKLLVIPRNELSEGLQRRLRVRGNTVSNLYEFKDEIEKIFESKSYSYSQAVRDAEDKVLVELKKGLLDHIRNGHTNLQTGGIGLEHLMCELMMIEGYNARVLAKTKFTGKADADVEAIRIDAFMDKKIFVQVKHHSGISPRSGIQQVIDVLHQTEYEDYDGYFVTSADIDPSDLIFAKENGIEVMDGHDLVELIIADMDKLSDTTRQQLGICRFPSLLKL